jgi:hypothetical protein
MMALNYVPKRRLRRVPASGETTRSRAPCSKIIELRLAGPEDTRVGTNDGSMSTMRVSKRFSVHLAPRTPSGDPSGTEIAIRLR